MKLGVSTYLRFCASGAVCASGVHLALTPLDVVKTKVQTNPIKYPNVGAAFQTVFQEEGLSTFFTGWVPTFLGNFLSGAVLYAITEIVRRYLTEAAGTDASSLEVPIILASAALASFVGSFLSCPFEAVRIRTVAQPDYAPNFPGVVARMYEEEGLIKGFLNAIPVFLVKNIPYAMVKFTVFDISTERLLEAFPAANEDLKLSLLITLVGGVMGGIAAAIISNPADAVISELKKAKSDMSPQEALEGMLERAGFASLLKGLPLRMVFYSMVVSLQFLVYDSVRFALGIGPDDLKLYLDVLGGALKENGGPL
jgi:solute carrier family 25 phosphate transporter 3